MKTLYLLFALMLLLPPAVPGNTESDTVVCWRNNNLCATLLCPIFYRQNGTCFSKKQKCCSRWL
ncbi:beta-defensin 12-like [Eublepharis macularius]|uniref:Beta-defensin 12-like n=1 Tax=Eublepharis macularius TaxID=481883 RepID=A0AA97LL56_EUBMA|nr:beta-defensin 12-like [Eublepharis macularius]